MKWGILGALGMRGIFIFAGIELLERIARSISKSQTDIMREAITQ